MPALWDTLWLTNAFGTVGDWGIMSSPDGGVSGNPYINTSQVNNVGGFAEGDDLGTAVLLSLFTDARLPDYMINQFGYTIADQHEWHGNTYSIDGEEEPLGSLLWVLRRAPLSDYTCRMAEHFAAAALQTLVRQKRASSFEIYATIDKKRGMLQMHIKAFGPTDREWFSDLFPLQ